MKKFPLYHAVFLGIAIVALFLPARQYKLWNYNLFGGGGSPSSGTIYESGFQRPEMMIPVGLLLLIMIIVVSYRHLATAIIGLILSAVELFSLLIVLFVLTFELFSSKTDLRPGAGYILIALISVAYFAMMIRHLVLVIRERRNEQRTVKGADVLDDL